MRSFHSLSFVLSVFLLSCFPSSQAQHLHGHENAHARRQHADKAYRRSDAKYKRDANVAFTYFVDGQGACGAYNNPSDFIVALNSAEYNSGAHCFEWITITIDGKTAQAQITDECPGCSPGGLDFSQGLFQFFAPLSEGELHGSWSYNSDTSTPSSTPPAPTTSNSPSWTPVTTVAITSPTPSVIPTTITTSLTSAVVPTQTSTASIVPTSTAQDAQTITEINLALLELGALLQASFKLEA